MTCLIRCRRAHDPARSDRAGLVWSADSRRPKSTHTFDLGAREPLSLLADRHLPPDNVLIFFIAPPWGAALEEVAGLDLRHTTPPVTDILGDITRTYPSQRVLLTTQVYEKLNPTSLRDVQALLDWSELRVYDLNDAGKNHGVLLGTSGWKP